MQLSVVILNYNVCYFLEQCVLSVQRAIQNIDAEIIVVDNASADESCAMIKTLFPAVKLIENKENFGFPKGNNIGVAQAKGEYICILNPDTVVAEDTFEKLLAKSCQLSAGIIGCKLIDGTGNFLPESKRGVPTPWVAFTKIFGLYKFFPNTKWFNQYYAQHLADNQSGKVDILVGAFMVMKRELYLEVGGFDENCFMYSDDIDLSYLVKKAGKDNYYFAETSVIHYKGESTVRDAKYMKRFSDAMQFFYKKHFGGSVLFEIMMKIGSFVFVFFKKQQQKKTQRKIDSYSVYTKNNLKLAFNKPTIYCDDIQKNIEQSSKNIEIILDTDSFSFAEIIRFMEQNKAKNITFKNYIASNNYLIGSNHANDIGEIIKMSKIE